MQPSDEETTGEIAQAGATEIYRNFMIQQLVDLTALYEQLMMNMLQGRSDERVANATISKMISIYLHIRPKVFGAGAKLEGLQKEFESFDPWVKNLEIPKSNQKEAARIPDLFNLIRNAFERLNLSKL